MKRILHPIIVLAALLCGCTSRTVDSSTNRTMEGDGRTPPTIHSSLDRLVPRRSEEIRNTENYVSFPSVGVKLPKPEGFEEADGFHGFGQPETQSSVTAILLPMSYAQGSNGMSRERVEKNGWTFLDREQVTVDGLPGFLVHFEHPADGVVFQKWSLFFGDSQKSIMVTAAFPKSMESKLSARLKSVVLGTRLDDMPPPPPGSDLPFTLKPSEILRPAPGSSLALFLTKDGVAPLKSPSDPLLAVAAVRNQSEISDKRDFAERRLRETREKHLSVKSINSITIDGLDGYELLADAEHERSGAKVVIYFLILFDGDLHIVLQGSVGSDSSKVYLPEFKAMALSIKRKRG